MSCDLLKSHSFLLRTLFIGALVLITGCRSDFSPPWPPDLDPQIYQPQLQNLGPVSADRIDVSVAGIRIAKGGLYVDVLYRGPADAHIKTAAMVDSWRILNHPPEDFLTVGSVSSGKLVRLSKYERPSRPLKLTFATVSWAELPQYELATDDSSIAIVQVLMWETESQLQPGDYVVTLKQWETASSSHRVDTTPRRLRADFAVNDLPSEDHAPRN